MQEIAKFEKVSFREYVEANRKIGRDLEEWKLKVEWMAIQQPTRATRGSAGYDFYAPFTFSISDNPVHIVTGIRCRIDPGWFLMCCPKSGLGFKHGMHLSNTIGIIDSDYYCSDNQGHIQAKFTSYHPMTIECGMKFMQGVFLPYGITDNDDASAVRNGGFGSTGA